MGAYFLKKQARSPILEGFGRNIYALLSFSGQQYFVIPSKSTAVCLIVGSIFAVVAAIVSSLRLSQPSTLKNNS